MTSSPLYPRAALSMTLCFISKPPMRSRSWTSITSRSSTTPTATRPVIRFCAWWPPNSPNVTGGGRAYRVGGEEFSILFRGKSLKDAFPHLEQLRAAIGASRFRVRAGEERRGTSRSPDSRGRGSRAEDSRGQDSRRQDFRGNDLRDQALRDRDFRDEDLREQDSPSQVAKNNDRRRSNRRSETRRTSGSRSRTRPAGVLPESSNRDLSVTVSIGVAEPGPGTRAVEQVIESADQALYRAKHSGRNRVEPAHPKPKRNIA